MVRHFAACLAMVASLACRPPASPPSDAGHDAGQVLVLGTPDSGVETVDGGALSYSPEFAGESCASGDPPHWLPDGGLHVGLCAALERLSGVATLNGRPLTSFTLQFIGGGYQSELAHQPDSAGVFEVLALRGRYDVFRYQPDGVAPAHQGFVTVGALDLTRAQVVNLAARSHRLRGGAFFGGVPFTPSAFPSDVTLLATSSVDGQRVGATSLGGAYETALLEGSLALFLSSPPQALAGTELIEWQLDSPALDFTTDQQLDIDLPTSVLEGRLTFDGAAMPDRRVGTDFTLSFTRPGDRAASVLTRHEGGLPQFSALVPRQTYGVLLSFEGTADRHLPSKISNKSLTPFIDLRRDAHLEADFRTVNVEGALLIDHQPIRLLPSSTVKLYLFAAADALDVSSYSLYELPQDSSAFSLRVFPARYAVVLVLDDTLTDDLVQGYWVVNRTLEVRANATLPVDLSTAYFTGHLLVDGHAAPAGKRAGWLDFRNRALDGQYSWFRRAVTVGEDGFYRVRLPKGEYEVHFTIDAQTFPSHASGRQLMAARVTLDDTVVQDLNYDTVSVSGPFRLGAEVIADTIGGPEAGLVLERTDGVAFQWAFEGGASTYELRIPPGAYAVQFVVNREARAGVAAGSAPMGLLLDTHDPDQPLKPHRR